MSGVWEDTERVEAGYTLAATHSLHDDRVASGVVPSNVSLYFEKRNRSANVLRGNSQYIGLRIELDCV